MSAGQESGSPIRENRTLLPAPLPPDEARGTLAAAAGVSTVGLPPPFDTPAAAFSSRLSRRSHLDCRAATLSGRPYFFVMRFKNFRAAALSRFAVTTVSNTSDRGDHRCPEREKRGKRWGLDRSARLRRR